MNTILTVAEATKRVEDFYALKAQSLKSGNKASNDFQMDARARTYRMVGNAAEVIQELMANEEVFGELCSQYNLKPAGEGQNPYTPGISILFRTKKDGKDIADRSAWKYSKTIRYGIEAGWKATSKKTLGEVFAEKLEKLEVEVGGKKLKRMIAAEMADKAKYGDKVAEDEALVEQAALNFMTKMPGMGAFQSNLGVDLPKSGQLVNVVASYDAENGQWVVRALTNSDHDRAWASIKRNVVRDFRSRLEAYNAEKSGEQMALANIDLDQLLEDLANHNAEVDAINATAGTFRKMTVWEQTHDGLFQMPSEHTVPVEQDLDDAAQEAVTSNAA